MKLHILAIQTLNSVISFSVKEYNEIPGYRRLVFSDAFIARYINLLEEDSRKKKKVVEEEERPRRRRIVETKHNRKKLQEFS